VRLPNNGTFKSNSITLLTWFNAENLKRQQTIWQFSSEGRLAILLALHVDKLQLDVYPNCDGSPLSFSPSVTLETSTWYFIGISYHHSTGLIHFLVRGTDGAQHYKFFGAGFIELETHHDIWLGYGPESPGAFSGSIACVQIYSVWLSEDEITNAQKMCLPRQWSGRHEYFELKSEVVHAFLSIGRLSLISVAKSNRKKCYSKIDPSTSQKKPRAKWERDLASEILKSVIVSRKKSLKI